MESKAAGRQELAYQDSHLIEREHLISGVGDEQGAVDL